MIKDKNIRFILFGFTCFLLSKSNSFSFKVTLSNDVTFDLLYIPFFLSIVLILLLGFEKLLTPKRDNHLQDKVEEKTQE